MKLKDCLKKAEQGTAYWYAKTSKDDCVSTSGLDKCWFRRDSTIEELQAALADRDETYTYFYCQQWQKVGRKIELVKVEEIDLSESVVADNQTIITIID